MYSATGVALNGRAGSNGSGHNLSWKTPHTRGRTTSPGPSLRRISSDGVSRFHANRSSTPGGTYRAAGPRTIEPVALGTRSKTPTGTYRTGTARPLSQQRSNGSFSASKGSHHPRLVNESYLQREVSHHPRLVNDSYLQREQGEASKGSQQPRLVNESYSQREPEHRQSRSKTEEDSISRTSFSFSGSMGYPLPASTKDSSFAEQTSFSNSNLVRPYFVAAVSRKGSTSKGGQTRSRSTSNLSGSNSNLSTPRSEKYASLRSEAAEYVSPRQTEYVSPRQTEYASPRQTEYVSPRQTEYASLKQNTSSTSLQQHLMQTNGQITARVNQLISKVDGSGALESVSNSFLSLSEATRQAMNGDPEVRDLLLSQCRLQDQIELLLHVWERTGNKGPETVEKVITKTVVVENPVEKVVEVPVTIDKIIEKEVPVTVTVEKTVEMPTTVTVEVETPVTIEVEVPVTVEKQVTVEKLVTVEKEVEMPPEMQIVERTVERIVTKPIEKVVTKIVEKPVGVMAGQKDQASKSAMIDAKQQQVIEKLLKIPAENMLIVEKIIEVPVKPKHFNSPTFET